jgi:hypothetical protein
LLDHEDKQKSTTLIPLFIGEKTSALVSRPNLIMLPRFAEDGSSANLSKMSFIAVDHIGLAIFKKQHKVVIASLTVPMSDSSFPPLPWKSEPPSFRSPYFSANSLKAAEINNIMFLKIS